ncbi:Microtubule-actin cross-linking factor 1, isoforms 1/2/3/5 [Dissostichus eleginoides]|nr:Microtubule-actin cross-linking factor 1, isoforms 1/2/3/5 [Dissostichus eleginoides]
MWSDYRNECQLNAHLCTLMCCLERLIGADRGGKGREAQSVWRKRGVMVVVRGEITQLWPSIKLYSWPGCLTTLASGGWKSAWIPLQLETQRKLNEHNVWDERDRVQKKTFTKWVNKHLIKVRKHITDLYEDLRDGHNLISLLEVLSGVTLQQKSGPPPKRAYALRAPPLILLEGGVRRRRRKELREYPREKGRMRFHRLQNVQIALDFLKQRQVKLVNIRNDDITDGNPKLTLGLIWTIILHFQLVATETLVRDTPATVPVGMTQQKMVLQRERGRDEVMMED